MKLRPRGKFIFSTFIFSLILISIPETFAFLFTTPEAQAAAPAGQWWNGNYTNRSKITITAGSAAVPNGYTVSLTFNHASLVSGGKSQADGDDIRVVYWNGASWEELDRFRDLDTPWNTASTKIWFKIRAGISASSSDDNYYLYYNNSSAINPPTNGNNVFLFYDGFESGNYTAWDGTWTSDAGDSITINTTTVNTGVYSSRSIVGAPTPGQAAAEKRFTAQTGLHTTVWVNVADWDAVEDVSIVQFYGGIWGAQQGSLSLRADGFCGPTRTVFIWNAPAGEGYCGTTQLNLNQWYRLEMKIIRHPTAGRAELWVNGVREVNQSGINTGSLDFEQQFAGIFWKSTGVQTLYIDDVFTRIWVDPEPTTSQGSEESPPMAMNPLIAYSNDAVTDLDFSTYSYSSGSWSAGTLAYDHNRTINWKVAKTSPDGTRQVVVWMEESPGVAPFLYASIYNGSAWSTSSLGMVYDGATDYRWFDVAFENLSGEVVVAAAHSTANQGRILYWVWNGTSWSGAGTYDTSSSANFYWVKMASKQGSNEIALIAADSASKAYGLIWNGSTNTFGNEAYLSTASGTLSSISTECIAVQYESSGDREAIFVWGEDTGDIYYTRWNGATYNNRINHNTNIPGTIRWLRLKADPNSDNMILGIGNDNNYNDIYGLRWLGTGWSTASSYEQQFTANASGNGDYNRSFDAIYESGSHSGHIIFVYSTITSGLVYRHFNGTSWESEQSVNALDLAYWVQLDRQGAELVHLAIHSAYSSTLDDLRTYTWDNSLWSFRNTISTDLERDVAGNRQWETFSIAGGPGLTFEYRRQITISELSGDCDTNLENLSDFPVLIDSTNWPIADKNTLRTVSNGGHVYSSNGYDIIFRASDGKTHLDHEIEKYDGTNGTLVAWVKIPTLYYNQTTQIYMYYGNPGVIFPTANPPGVWSNGFREVWHLHETGGGTVADSTANGYTGTAVDSVNQNATGKIDGADEFVGPSASRLSLLDGILASNSPFSIEAWFYMETLQNLWVGLVTKGRDSGVPDWVGIGIDDTNQLIFYWDWNNGGNVNGSSLSAGGWYHTVATFDGTERRLYLNGNLDAGPSGPATYGNILDNTRVGDDGNGNYLDGFIDEVRISSVVRDLCWIQTSYNSMNDPATYITVGSEEGPSPPIPTTVKLKSFKATQYEEGVLLRWKTGYEVDNLGFHVYREEKGQLTRLTPEPVAGTALLAGSRTALRAGHRYHWWDTSVKGWGDGEIRRWGDKSAIRYWLEDIDLNGKRTMHGPVYPVLSREPIPEKFTPELLSEIGWRLEERYHHYWRARELKEKLALKRLEIRGRVRLRSTSFKVKASNLKAEGRTSNLQRLWAEGRSSRPGADLLMQQHLASRPAVKLLVREEGWYRVAQSELLAAGLSPRANPRYLQLYVDGREQPIRVIGKGAKFEAIEFYGTGLDTPSTDTRVYWLVEGLRAGKRLTSSPVLPARVGGIGWGGQISPVSYPHTIERKERRIYFGALRNGDEGNFFGSLVYPAVEVDQLFEVRHLDQGASEDALLEVALQGVTSVAHRVKVLVNEAEVGEVVFEGQSRGVASFPISQSLLEEGDNVVTLVAEGGEMDASVIDTIRLTYWHTYTAEDNGLRFKAQGGEPLSIGGFGSSGIRVFDITEEAGVREVLGRVQFRDGSYAVGFRVPGHGQRTLLALTEEKIKGPERVITNQPSSWYQVREGYDFVIISHRDFLGSLDPLGKLRESQGLRVALIDIEDLYDEFSFGVKTPKGIKDFLTYARAKWQSPPRYVLLVGDASYDPRNYLGLGDFDLMPTKLIDTSYFETASDDWFVDFNNDGLPEMAMGRLPVQTKEEAAIIVSKIVGYERSIQKREVLLVSDIDDGFSFEGASEEVRALLPGSLMGRKIYRGQFSSDAQARQELISGINQGPLLVNFIGHGSIGIWNGVLSSEDVEYLTNRGLPFFVGMSCLNGHFQDVYMDSLSEALMKAPGAGAVAVWMSSGLTQPDKQAVMNKELIRLLFGRESLSLGEATARAKASVSDQDIRKTWILFGDPSTRLK